jgi:hypothetical protein
LGGLIFSTESKNPNRASPAMNPAASTSIGLFAAAPLPSRDPENTDTLRSFITAVLTDRLLRLLHRTTPLHAILMQRSRLALIVVAGWRLGAAGCVSSGKGTPLAITPLQWKPYVAKKR